jgi:hypothetical protein
MSEGFLFVGFTPDAGTFGLNYRVSGTRSSMIHPAFIKAVTAIFYWSGAGMLIPFALPHKR